MPTHETTTELFNQIAPKYDLMNHLMSFELDRLWRRRAVRRIADKRQPLKVLDLATGTGDLAIATARRMGADGTVTGVDLSEEMLIQGRFKVAEEGLQKNIELIKGNAESLPFDNDSFDRVSVAFGVRNYENLADGLREACRVLRPGGRMVILELSYPDNALLLKGYKLYALKFLPWLGEKISGHREAYTYLPESILRFPKPAQFIPLLEEAGFQNCQCKSLSFGICRLYTAEKAAR